MRWPLLFALAACGGGSENPIDARPSADATVDGRADAAIDGVLVDAFVDDCPNRTAGVGEPQLPISQAEVRSGDVTIRTAVDVTLLAGIRYIDGNVTIDTDTLTEIVLPDLEAVRGQLQIPISTTSLTRLELPKLETVGLGIFDQAQSLEALIAPRFETYEFLLHAVVTTFEVPCLRGVIGPLDATWNLTLRGPQEAVFELPKYERGNIRIANMPNVTEVRLPRLVHGSLDIARSANTNGHGMPLVARIEMPRLESAHVLALADLPALTSLVVQSGVDFVGLQLQNLPQLPDLAWLAGATYEWLALEALPLVTTLPGAVRPGLNAVRVAGVPLVEVSALSSLTFASSLVVTGTNATVIDLPTLVAVENFFEVIGNRQLTLLSAPQFDEITSSLGIPSYIRNNSKLPNCQATAIRDRVVTDAPFLVANNLPDACQ